MMCILFGVAVAFGGCEGRPSSEANMQTGYVITMEELGAPFGKFEFACQCHFVDPAGIAKFKVDRSVGQWLVVGYRVDCKDQRTSVAWIERLSYFQATGEHRRAEVSEATGVGGQPDRGGRAGADPDGVAGMPGAFLAGSMMGVLFCDDPYFDSSVDRLLGGGQLFGVDLVGAAQTDIAHAV
jgi:hypothetical protein